MKHPFSKRLRTSITKAIKLAFAVVICLSGLAPAARADESCGDLSGATALITMLQHKNWDEIEITPRYAARIGQYVSATQSSQFRALLLRKKRARQLRQVDRLLVTALLIANTKSVGDRAALQNALQEFNVVMRSTCGAGRGSDAGTSRNAKEGASSFSEKTDLVIESFVADKGRYALSLGVVFLLLFLVSCLLLVKSVYSIAYGYIYHRKTCRITASMRFGARTIYGYIIVLGRNGCRFAPEQGMDVFNLSELITQEQPCVDVLDNTLPCMMNGVTDSYFSVFFADQLSMKVLNEIFKKSIITPVHRRKDVMKPNLAELGLVATLPANGVAPRP